jgi:hypothetical protein
MLELFADLDLSTDAAAYIAQGLRSLAACDGTHANEIALVEEFERGLNLEPGDGDAFELADGGPLTTLAERELFMRSLQLMALADGRISTREKVWIDEAAGELGINDERKDELAVEARKFLLGSLAGVKAFYKQAFGVGLSLGLAEADIVEILGPDPR